MMLENYVPDPENYEFVHGEKTNSSWHIWRIDSERPLCAHPTIKRVKKMTEEPPGKICKRCVGHANELWD